MVYCIDGAPDGVQIMKMDKKQLIEKAKEKKPKRYRTSFALDSAVYKRFLEVCKKANVSGAKIIEQFMKDFGK
jgi:glycerol-3-phosphate responsive antiterminator